MAKVHPNSLKALKENRKKTQINGEVAVRYQKKSVESRRRNKSLAECAKLFGDLPVSEKEKEELAKQGIDAEDMTNNMALIRGQYASAKRGNSNSARFLAELREELKQQQTNVTVNNTVDPFDNLTDDELRSAIASLKKKYS